MLSGFELFGFFCCLCFLNYRKSTKHCQWDEEVAEVVTMPYGGEGRLEYFEPGMVNLFHNF